VYIEGHYLLVVCRLEKEALTLYLGQTSHDLGLGLSPEQIPFKSIITFAALLFLGHALRNDQNIFVRDLCYGHP
jgi:hypothetical protein